MEIESIFESLKYQFDEAVYECDTKDGLKRYKSEPLTKLKFQTIDYAVIEYDGKNPVYTSWLANYMSEHDFSTDRVKEIRLIGEPMQEKLESLKELFPNANIVIVDKEIKELEFEDLYCEYTLVFHFFGDLFLRDKAYKTEVKIKLNRIFESEKVLTTVPRRNKLEALAELIRETRYIYNIFAYNCQGDDMDWQMSQILKVLNPDSRMVANNHKETYVCGNLFITSLKWNEDDSISGNLKPKIAFEDRKFNPTKELFYDRPLKESRYLDGLSEEKCGRVVSKEELRIVRGTDCYDEFKQSSPYEIASEFRIYNLRQLFEDNDEICDDIIERYMEASSDGIFGASNNLGVFYVQTEQYAKAKEYFNKAVKEGDEKALVNLYVLALIEERTSDADNLKKHLAENKSQCSLWNKAIDLWKDEQYNQAVYLFEKLSKEKDDKFQAAGKGLCQMAIKNLIKIYLEGKPEAGISKNYTKVQKLLEKVDYEDNKELIACCLIDNILTTGDKRDNSDKRVSFDIIRDLYKRSIHVSNHSYNMAGCYALGIGCEKDLDKAIDICDKYLSEHDADNVKILKGYIFSEKGDKEKFKEIIESLQNVDFIHRFNAAIIYKGDEFKNRMLELEKVPGCTKCNEACKYNEILMICPKVIEIIGSIYRREGLIEKAKSYYERAAGFGRASACYSIAVFLKKEGDTAKAFSMHRKAMMYGGRDSLIYLHDNSNNKVDKLHYLLLLEGFSSDKDGMIQYKIYEKLKDRCISKHQNEELVWLKRSADNEYEPAIIAYANKLMYFGEDKMALEYLRKYKGDDEEVKKNLAELEEKVAEEYEDDDDDYYDGYNSGGYEWTDEDAWDAMTDGMYGDYPGSGWDPEMFGY